MKTEIRLNRPNRSYRPGDMVEGEVVLRSTSRQRIEEVRVTAASEHEDVGSVDGKLSGACTVEGELRLPLLIRLPSGTDDAEWTIRAEVEGEEDDWSASIKIAVAVSAATKAAQNIWQLLFSLPAIAVGALGIGFGIGGAPGKIIPVGVLWFAFIGGCCALLVARAIMGGRDRNQSVSWLGVPITLALVALGLVGLYIAMIQPDLVPVKPLLHSGPVHSLLSMLDGAETRARMMSLLAAGLLLPIAAGVMTRRPVSPGLQAEIALVVVSTMLAIVVLGGVIGGLATTGQVPPIADEMWVGALIGVIAVSGTFSRPTWTAAPAVTVAAGVVPILVGALALYASFKPGSGAAAAERIVAAVTLLWGVVVIYRGGRNVIVALGTAGVEVAITPENVPIGGSMVVNLSISPRRDVTLSAISGVLRCERVYARTVGTERRTDTQTVHKDRRVLQLNEQLQAGASVRRELRFVIPIGLNPSDDSSTSGTYWTLDVKAQFEGSADWAYSYPITVVSER